MKKFLHNFAITSDSQFLVEAFLSSAEAVGWTNGSRDTRQKNTVFFNANKLTGYTKPGQYNYCDIASNVVTYKLPQQWDEAIKIMSKEAQVTYSIGDVFEHPEFPGAKYLLSTISQSKISLICINKGECKVSEVGLAFSEPIQVEDFRKITQKEFNEFDSFYAKDMKKIN